MPFLAAGMLSLVGVQAANLAPAAAASTGDINAVAGNGQPSFSGDGGPATSAQVNHPDGVVVDPAGDIYFSDEFNMRVRKIDPFGTVTTVAGTGQRGYFGDGGPATAAGLSFPSYLALDKAGDLYIADQFNDRIRMVNPLGIITTFAGNGIGFNFPPDMGDGGPAANAYFSSIGGVAADSAGNVYISDPGFAEVRKVDPAGIITTLAKGIFGADGLSFANNGALLVGTNRGVLDEVNVATGQVTVLAGNLNNGGVPGGDGGPATQATLIAPFQAVADAAGNIFLVDGQSFSGGDNAIRKIDTTGIITTIAGGPAAGFSGDGGPASAAQLNNPNSLALLPDGTLLVTDTANSEVRAITGAPNLLRLADVGANTVAAGASFTYQLAITDNGSDGDAPGVTVTDQLPAGVTYQSATPSEGSCQQAGGSVTCDLGTVTSGTTATVTIAVTAPNASTSLVNSATVSSTQTDPFGDDNSATATTAVAPVDLAVTMAASPNTNIDIGQTTTFTGTVTNNGPADATRVTLTDTLPPNLTFTSASASQGSCANPGQTVTCILGALTASSTATVTIQVTAKSTGPLTNSASVGADQADPYLANNTARVELIISGAGCGQVIASSTKLKADIGPCAFDGVVLGADKITLNLNGHRIFGIGDGVHFGTLDGRVGIDLEVRTKDIIEGGTVSGFDAGIFIDSGLSNTVTRMTVRDNIGEESSGPLFPNFGDGILIQHSSYNKILTNKILHNGTYDGIGLFGGDTDANLIQGNTVENTITNLSHADGEGIIINNFLAVLDERRSASLAYNNIIGNLVEHNAASGISNVSNDFAKIENNTAIGNGLLAFPKNGIGDQVGRVANQTAADIISGNVTSGNGGDGIQVLAPLNGDTITNNTSSSNNVLNIGRFNYEDTNGNCTANQWTSNTSTNGTVSPSCILPGSAAAPAAVTAAPTAAAPPSSTTLPPIPQAHRTLPPPPGLPSSNSDRLTHTIPCTRTQGAHQCGDTTFVRRSP